MATWYTQFLFTVKPECSQDGRDGVPGVMDPAHGEKPLSVVFGVNTLFFFNHPVAFSAHSWRENDFQEAECIWCLWGSHVSKHCTPGLFRRRLYGLRTVLKLLCPGWRRVNTVSFECHHGLCWICYFSHKMAKRGPRTGRGWVEWGCLRTLSHSRANSHGVCNHSNHGLKNSQDADMPLYPPSGSLAFPSIPSSRNYPHPHPWTVTDVQGDSTLVILTSDWFFISWARIFNSWTYSWFIVTQTKPHAHHFLSVSIFTMKN